ncbi:hypothetical protein XENOCAPTIV_029664 [Xenoophorus captivus]|uniref:Uncharacterized protein n=1 Tax=Xenoophorus captivus TaxID=1517983 RepID=A0ABV0QNM8_9TELE
MLPPPQPCPDQCQMRPEMLRNLNPADTKAKFLCCEINRYKPEMNDLTTGTSKSVLSTFPKEKEASLSSSQLDRIILSAGPIENTSQVSLLTPQHNTTTASVKLTTTTVSSTTKTPTTTTSTLSLRVTTHSTTTTTPQPQPVTRGTTKTIRTYTSRRPSHNQKASSPRDITSVFVSPFTTTTEAPQPQCNITERLWVKTGKPRR